MNNNIVKFVRSKDYKLLRELGRGACGKTVLLHDDIINETFVCKKYAPFDDAYKEELFGNFVQEIKLLHLINHLNIVRVFNYYIYPEHLTGYILMEHIQGTDIDEYLRENPENINEAFMQTIEGFSYLEINNILHRDIRPLNIMVTNNGILKIIDFGFGKQAQTESDFDKSISLNWWCEPPPEFKTQTYDFGTEVYFVGKLFEKIITENNIEHFKYSSILQSMCISNKMNRACSFVEIRKNLLSNKFAEYDFSDYELSIYREFSNYLANVFTKIEHNAKYYDDPMSIQAKLESAYKKVMLEEQIPNNSILTRCFVDGSYYFQRTKYFPVSYLKQFLNLLRQSSIDKKNIIISNLQSKLDSIERYYEDNDFDDDIPF